MKKKLINFLLVVAMSISVLVQATPVKAEETCTASANFTEDEAINNNSDNEIVEIEDDNLRKALNIKLGKPEDSELTKGELKLITSLDISNSNITSLQGLEYCGNLISLNISHNSVTDITPLENLSEIVDLNISYNNITDVKPLEGLKNLITIDTTSNSIVNIDILDGILKIDGNSSSDKIIDVSLSEDLSNLINIDISSITDSNFDFSSTLDDIISNNTSSGSNNSSNLGSDFLSSLGGLDITKLLSSSSSLGSLGGFGTGSFNSLGSLGSLNKNLGTNLSSNSSTLKNSSNTLFAKPTNTGDAGFITLSLLALSSLTSLIFNRKKF